MIVLPQKYILQITSTFHLYFAILVQTTWSIAADLSGVLCFLSCPQSLLYIWEWEWCSEFTYQIVSPPDIILSNCLTFAVEQPTDFLTISWHALPNAAPALLCDLNSYNSLLFPDILASLIVLSVLNTCQPHHCLEGFALVFLSSCVTLSLDHSMVGFFSSFSFHREAFLPTSSKGPPISPETLYPLILLVYS